MSDYPHDEDPAGSGPAGKVEWGPATTPTKDGRRYQVGRDTLGWWWWRPWLPGVAGIRGRWAAAIGHYASADEAEVDAEYFTRR